MSLRFPVNPGQSPHPPHEHPEEELLLVVEGQGEFVLDGQPTPCSAGAMLYAAPGHLHGFANTGSAPMTVPAKQPKKAIVRLKGVSATEKP